MIDYETFCKIKDYHQQRQLKVAQIARELCLNPEFRILTLSAGVAY